MAMKKKPGTALVNYREQMLQDAQAEAGMVANIGGGSFFSLKSGVLGFNGTPFPNNEIACVILDSMFENTYYDTAYDSNEMSPPKCFAFSKDESTLTPHDTVIERGAQENDVCKGCPQNQFGTADRGKGKACGNRMRLALLPAGGFSKGRDFIAPGDDYATIVARASFGFLKLPPTSVRPYANFVKSVNNVLHLPTYAIYTRIWVEPSSDNQFSVLSEPLGPIPEEFWPAIIAKREEAKAQIDIPYSAPEAAPARPAPSKGKGKPAASARAPGRR